MADIAGISNVNVRETLNKTKIDSTYKASKFSDKYKIDQYVYPSDLQSPDYAGNKVVFYINIAEASKFAQNANEDSFMTDIDIPRIRGPLIGGDYSVPGIIASGYGTSIAMSAYAGAKIASDALFGGGARATGKAAAVGGAVGAVSGAAILGLGALALNKVATTATRAQKRLKAAIALHTPNNLNIRYSTNWESEDTAGGVVLAELGQAGIDAITKFFTTGSMKLPTENEDAPISHAIANIALQKGPNAGMISAATGLAANPRKEQVFKGVDFRTFTFDYQFFPRSEPEAKNVENIIQMFKFHMHPEMKDAKSFIYLYPSEFDIVYYKGSDENLHIHRHTSCVLVDMGINYTPNGNFNTFSNGMPTQINITLTFKELALMDKDMIANGL
jgi:hypothetical protein